MRKENKVRLTGIILMTLIIVGGLAVTALIAGWVPQEIVSKEAATMVGISICFPLLFCICCPWNMFTRDEKPSRLPAPIDHPVWDKRKLDSRMYGTVQPVENHLRRVA